jgi:hypothetical protein
MLMPRPGGGRGYLKSPPSRSVQFTSVSSRISKGQGYRGFLRKRAGSRFGQKKGNLRRTRKNLKNGQNSLLFRVNKMFSHKF